jgi:capsular polysaccharide biosynthesis protein
LGRDDNPLTLADYLSILWRRKWILVALPLVAGIVAYAITDNGTPAYQANALVLLNRADVVSGVTNTQDPAVFDSTRFLTTQANIARSPALANRVADASDIPGLTAGAVLGSSTVTPEPDSDLLRFSVSTPNPDAAVRIANTYATEFTKFKTELDTVRVDNALREIRSRLRSLEARGQSEGAAYQALTQYQSQLMIGRLLLTDSASVLEPAAGASEIGATPQRNMIAGVLLGLVLALGIAFVAEALDRRVRTEDEIEEALGLPLLGRVARPPHHVQKTNRPVMLVEPLSAYSETFRRLRTNIEFVNTERRARTIMITSAVPKEGKSTTAANIAIAFARAGSRVALVDLDVRLPTQHTLFGVRPDHGIAEIVLNDEPLERALQRIALPPLERTLEATGNGRRVAPPTSARWSPTTLPKRPSLSLSTPASGRPEADTFLHLLVGGRVPRAHGEFLHDERITSILRELGESFDIVLVDSPPLLAVGDAMALSAKVDAIVVVTHLGIRRPVLDELSRQLQNCPATPLGFVVTGVAQPDGYGYGYGYGATVSQLERTAERSR